MRGMRKYRSRTLIAGAAILIAGLSLTSSAQGSTYPPGTSTPHKPTLNAEGNWDYSCSYANWVRGPVTWHCDLDMHILSDIGILYYSAVATHSGSWTPG